MSSRRSTSPTTSASSDTDKAVELQLRQQAAFEALHPAVQELKASPTAQIVVDATITGLALLGRWSAAASLAAAWFASKSFTCAVAAASAWWAWPYRCNVRNPPGLGLEPPHGNAKSSARLSDWQELGLSVHYASIVHRQRKVRTAGYRQIPAKLLLAIRNGQVLLCQSPAAFLALESNDKFLSRQNRQPPF